MLSQRSNAERRTVLALTMLGAPEWVSILIVVLIVLAIFYFIRRL